MVHLFEELLMILHYCRYRSSVCTFVTSCVGAAVHLRQLVELLTFRQLVELLHLSSAGC